LQALKDRMSFVIKRWGKSGVIFAWDLWNEPDPLHAGNAVANIDFFIRQLSNHIRDLEMQLYGRMHLQTVSGYWPHLLKHPAMADAIFRHPNLDFATIHFYGHSALDKPTNTYLSAVRMGDLVNKAIAIIPENRPFFDSEHGPIHNFRKKKGKLPIAFDEQYFRHTQWAHMASGGAGGGLRWPYRHPHQLTKGMRQAQKSLSGFIKLVDWRSFSRKNIARQIKINVKNSKVFACGTNQLVIAWLFLREQIPNEQMLPVSIQIPAMLPGRYKVIIWDTLDGQMQSCTMYELTHAGMLCIAFTLFKADVALLIKRVEEN
jgi:mannan endo-1,4-beta-mannosidase